MKRLNWHLLIVLLWAATVAWSQEKLTVTPSSLLLQIPSGGMQSGYFQLKNNTNAPLTVKAAYDSNWMYIHPNVFRVEASQTRRILVVFFVPKNKKADVELTLPFHIVEDNSKTLAKITVKDPNPAAGQLAVDPGTAPTLTASPPINDSATNTPSPPTIDTNVANASNTALSRNSVPPSSLDSKPEGHRPDKSSEYYEVMLDSLRAEIEKLSRQLQKNEKFIASLQDELRNKDAKIAALVEQTSDRYAELDVALSESSVYAPFEQSQAQLKSLLQKMENDLKNEQEKDYIELGWIGNKLHITIAGYIAFSSGSTILTERGKTVLEKIGRILKQQGNRNFRLVVVGHTDAKQLKSNLVKLYTSNWELSAVRAATAARILQINSDVDGKKMAAVGSSSYRPIADNKTLKGRTQNRRLEILIAYVPEG